MVYVYSYIHMYTFKIYKLLQTIPVFHPPDLQNRIGHTDVLYSLLPLQIYVQT
jgi:hypothetical protein